MRIVGTGIDIIEISRVAAACERRGPRFLARVYADEELTAVSRTTSHKSYMEKLAVRFAAKEAVMKALGTGWRRGVAWKEIIVEHLPTGQPIVRLKGRTAAVADDKGITRIEITMSHNNETAVAHAIALSDCQG